MNDFGFEVMELDGGVGICGDSTDTLVIDYVNALCNGVDLVIADQPYGNIVSEYWDHVNEDQDRFADWMMAWTDEWARALKDCGAFYVWGGFGRQGFRPFFTYLSRVEDETQLEIANYITWSKKRAYGIQWGYLQTREELVYMVNGDHKQPATFNIPYLDQLRGYEGYNDNYPAKSDYLRRTSVWTDITEIFRGKEHPTQKPVDLYKVIIEASSNHDDWVVDPFAGYGTAAFAARELGRQFVVIERDERYAEQMFRRLS